MEEDKVTRLSDLKPGDWALCVDCPNCKTPEPYMPLPGYDPNDPLRTGLKAYLGSGRMLMCSRCEKTFHADPDQGVPRQISKAGE